MSDKKNFDLIQKRYISNFKTYNEYISEEKINIAVCLSGHIRSFKKNLDFYKKLNTNKNINVFYFAHFWDEKGYQVEVDLGPQPSHEKLISFELDEIKKIINFKKILIESNLKFISKIKNKINKTNFFISIWDKEKYINKNKFIYAQAKPEYIISQLYSIQKSFKLCENFSIQNNVNFDIVFKIRPDYNISSDLFLDEFYYAKTREDTIFKPGWPNSNHGHPTCILCMNMIKHSEHTSDVCDIFAFGKYNVMKEYMNVYDVWYNLNARFLKENFKKIKKYNLSFKKSNNYILINQLKNFNYYKINCFYPERIFKEYLKNYYLIPSKISGRLIR